MPFCKFLAHILFLNVNLWSASNTLRLAMPASQVTFHGGLIGVHSSLG